MRIVIMLLFFGTLSAFAAPSPQSETTRVFDAFVRTGEQRSTVYMATDGTLSLTPAAAGQSHLSVGTLSRSGDRITFIDNGNPFPQPSEYGGTPRPGHNWHYFRDLSVAMARRPVEQWNRIALGANFPRTGGVARVWFDTEGRIQSVGTSDVPPSPNATGSTIVIFDPARGYRLADTIGKSSVLFPERFLSSVQNAPASHVTPTSVFPLSPARRRGYIDVIRGNAEVFDAFRASTHNSQVVWYHLGDGAVTTEAPSNPAEYLTGVIERDPRGNVTFHANPSPVANNHPLIDNARTTGSTLVSDSIIAHHNREFARANFTSGRGEFRVWTDSSGRFVSTGPVALRDGMTHQIIRFDEHGVVARPVAHRAGDAIPITALPYLEDLNAARLTGGNAPPPTAAAHIPVPGASRGRWCRWLAALGSRTH